MKKVLFKSKGFFIWFLIVSGIYATSTLTGYRILDLVSSDKPELVHDDEAYGSQHK